VHEHLTALDRLSELIGGVRGYEHDREFIFHARRKITAGEELPEKWIKHLGNLLIEFGTLRQFDADSEQGAYA
jgi:hypothetical protein